MSKEQSHSVEGGAVAAPSAGAQSTAQKSEKAEPGASWKMNEQQVVPYNRLGFVFAGLMCCIFLAAIDQVRAPFRVLWFVFQCSHISHCRLLLLRLYQRLLQNWGEAVTTAGLAGLFKFRFWVLRSWTYLYFICSAYMLAAASLGPLYGKLSDLVGMVCIASPYFFWKPHYIFSRSQAITLLLHHNILSELWDVFTTKNPTNYICLRFPRLVPHYAGQPKI